MYSTKIALLPKFYGVDSSIKVHFEVIQLVMNLNPSSIQFRNFNYFITSDRMIRED